MGDGPLYTARDCPSYNPEGNLHLTGMASHNKKAHGIHWSLRVAAIVLLLALFTLYPGVDWEELAIGCVVGHLHLYLEAGRFDSDAAPW